MLKLMKYDLRRLRNPLLIMLGTLVALEAGFIAGHYMHRSGLMAGCLTLITVLAFAVYAAVILTGMADYSRNLREKTGYLVFMVPVRPIGVVVSKLLFTALTALAATALFALAAFLDYRLVISRMDIDPQIMDQVNLILRFGLNADATWQQILRTAAFGGGAVLIQIMLTMCTAFLAITLSATLLQNRKGFLRGLISVVVFMLLTWGSGWLTNKLVYDRLNGLGSSAEALTGSLGWSLLLNGVLCALFAWASAYLLDRKVDL
ncbi:MAG: hypothetical protein IJH38_04070 [Clostridia bacterium]|nr:hypothetical protein [Clostridia bacterium]